MARDRIYTSSQYRSAIEELINNNVLEFAHIDNKDIFMTAVALGIDNPTKLKNKIGQLLNTTIKTADKALMASVLLGTVTDDSQIDEYADFDNCADLCEKCAEAGHIQLLAKYNDANCDVDIFERLLIKELDLLYTKNVEGDI